MICYYREYHVDNGAFWMQPLVNSKDRVYFAMLFTLRESLRNSESALLRIRSKELRLQPQTP